MWYLILEDSDAYLIVYVEEHMSHSSISFLNCFFFYYHFATPLPNHMPNHRIRVEGYYQKVCILSSTKWNNLCNKSTIHIKFCKTLI